MTITRADINHGASAARTSPISRAACPEWMLLLQCASRKAHPETGVPSNFDWAMLLRLASQHGVHGLLANYLHAGRCCEVPSSILSQIQESQRSHATLTLQLTAELFRVLDAFQAHELGFLLTKGPALSIRCYGDPSARHYSDLDLIVRHKDIRRATELMLDLGYQPKIPLPAIASGKTPGEYNFTKAGSPILIEFHTERTFRYHPHPLPVEKVFARACTIELDGRLVPVLALEDELILICIHGAKHFWERLLWIADVAALSQHAEINWERVCAAADEVGARRILHLGLRLSADLLSAPIPSLLQREVSTDRTVSQLATAVLVRLPDPTPPTLIQRAAFRVHMRGRLLEGLAYFLRLSLSPTEEDWQAHDAPPRSTLMEALLRPARLARKHRLPKT